MVFMAVPVDSLRHTLSAALVRWQDPTPGAYCRYVAQRPSWYHLYRSRSVISVTDNCGETRCGVMQKTRKRAARDAAGLA
jgi:hypothetical protein